MTSGDWQECLWKNVPVPALPGKEQPYQYQHFNSAALIVRVRSLETTFRYASGSPGLNAPKISGKYRPPALGLTSLGF